MALMENSYFLEIKIYTTTSVFKCHSKLNYFLELLGARNLNMLTGKSYLIVKCKDRFNLVPENSPLQKWRRPGHKGEDIFGTLISKRVMDLRLVKSEFHPLHKPVLPQKHLHPNHVISFQTT